MVMRHAALMLLALCASTACSKEITPATQVIVEIQADAVLQAQLSSIAIDVDGSRGRESSSYVDRFEYEVTKASGALHWPFVFPLAPLDDDAARTYRVVVTGQAADGKTIIAKALSGYVANETRTLRLYLASSCVDVTCEAADTCMAGVCGPATILPTDLPRLATPDAAVPDAGLADGNVATDGGVSLDLAMPPIDAGSDAAIDAAVDPCEGVLSATPTWTVSTTTSFDPEGAATFLDAVADERGLVVLSSSTATATSGHLRLSREIDGVWEVETVASGDTGTSGAVALDNDGKTLVAYMSVDRNRVYLAQQVDGTWTARMHFIGAGVTAEVRGLYVDAAGNARVLYVQDDGSVWKASFSSDAITTDVHCPSSECRPAPGAYYTWRWGSAPRDSEEIVAHTYSYMGMTPSLYARRGSTSLSISPFDRPTQFSQAVGTNSSLCVAAEVLPTNGYHVVSLYCSSPETTTEMLGRGTQPVLLVDRRDETIHLIYADTSASPYQIRHVTRRGEASSSSNIAEVGSGSGSGWSSSPIIAGVSECGVVSLSWYRDGSRKLARWR